MAEDRTLLPEPFSGSPKEDATEFWRRLETYLEYKGNDNSDKLRLATAMLDLTAMDWLENLPEERKDSFAHLKSAFAEKFIQSAILNGNRRMIYLQNNKCTQNQSMSMQIESKIWANV